MALEYDDILDTIRVDEVLDALGVTVSKIRNGNHWGDCPLHDDRNDHFSIDEDTLVWNCFHCGGGVLPQLVLQAIGFEDDELGRAWDQAIEWLLPFSDGGAVDERDTDGFLEQLERDLARGAVRTTRIRNVDLPVYSERVLKDLQEVPLEVMDRWNIHLQATMHTFKIGYDPERERHAYVGPAVVIPHFFSGRLVGYQERWLDEDRPAGIPKYTNTSDFPKSLTLFNWDRACRTGDFVIVVESVMSAVRLWELGYEAVATFGANISDEQIRLLRTIEKGLYLSFDNDKSGRAAMIRCMAHLMGEVPVYSLPYVDTEKGDIADLTGDEVVDLIAHRTAGLPA